MQKRKIRAQARSNYLRIEEAVRDHLTNNVLPAQPEDLVSPCTIAVIAVAEGNGDLHVVLPFWLTHNGSSTVKADLIVAQWYLHNVANWVAQGAPEEVTA